MTVVIEDVTVELPPLHVPNFAAEDVLNIVDRHDRPVDLHDFLWTSTDEPHASRRKLFLRDHNREIQACIGYEWKTKYVVVLLVAAQLGFAYLFREDALWGGTWQFYVFAYVVGAPITQALFLAVHELSHNLLFKAPWANKWFGFFTNLPMVLPFAYAYKGYHLEHHKNQGLDGVDTDLPTWWEAKLLSSRPGKWFFMFNQLWFYAFRPLIVRPQPVSLGHVQNFVIQIGFNLAVYHFVGVGALLYLLLCAHMTGGLHPLAAHFVAEHYVFSEGIETASYYGWMNRLTWNVGYHNEHHDFPNVAWSKLPQLSKIGKYKETIPYHESWVKAMWQFLVDDHVTFYNRIKRRGEELPADQEVELPVPSTSSKGKEE